MTDQTTLWEAADAARRDGMDRAAAHSPPGWNHRAGDMIRSYAAANEYFHVDEFWSWATPRGLDEPPNMKAIGPAVAAAGRAGVLIRTDRTAPSVRSNLAHKPIWRCAPFAGDRTGSFRGKAIG